MIAENREEGGRLVRLAWIRWAKQQPAPKPSWLVPWEGLSEQDKEADRMIWDEITAPYEQLHRAGNSYEILQLVERLNTREKEGATIAECKEWTTLIEQKSPGFQSVYVHWRGIDSWVLVPVSAIPPRMQRLEKQG